MNVEASRLRLIRLGKPFLGNYHNSNVESMCSEKPSTHEQKKCRLFMQILTGLLHTKANLEQIKDTLFAYVYKAKPKQTKVWFMYQETFETGRKLSWVINNKYVREIENQELLAITEYTPWHWNQIKERALSAVIPKLFFLNASSRGIFGSPWYCLN